MDHQEGAIETGNVRVWTCTRPVKATAASFRFADIRWKQGRDRSADLSAVDHLPEVGANGPDLPFVSRPVAAVRAVEGDFRRGSEI